MHVIPRQHILISKRIVPMQMAESYAHPFFVVLMVQPPSLFILLCNNMFYSFLVNFGDGPRIWIDNLDDAEGVLNEFAEYFADSSIKKVILLEARTIFSLLLFEKGLS